MGLDTNGWDYGYHINLEQANSIIETNSNSDANLISSVKSELKVEAPNTAIGDLLGLNKYVVSEIKKFLPLLRDKALEQYGDLDVSKFAEFKISKTHTLSDSVVDYLLDIIDDILKEIHKQNKGESLLFRYNKINMPGIENLYFSDNTERAIIKSRAKTYFEYEHYEVIYDLTTPISTYGSIINRDLNYLLSNQANIKPLIETLLTTLIPIKYLNKATAFFYDNSIDSKNWILLIDDTGKMKFELEGDGLTANISYELNLTVKEPGNATALLNNFKQKIDIQINLNWVANSFKADSSINPKSLTILNLDVTSIPIGQKGHIESCIRDYFNESITTINYIDGKQNYYIHKTHHRYHHALSYFNIASVEALKKEKVEKEPDYKKHIVSVIERFVDKIDRENKLNKEDKIKFNQKANSLINDVKKGEHLDIFLREKEVNQDDGKFLIYFFEPLTNVDFSSEVVPMLWKQLKTKLNEVKNDSYYPKLWMFPTTSRYAVQDSAKDANLANSVFSICCMIKENINNNSASAQINAIPFEAKSALIIDRGVFAEHLVVPQIAKDVLHDWDHSGESEEKMLRAGSFVKSSAYSFTNDEGLKMKYSDFKRSLTHLGLLGPFDFLPLALKFLWDGWLDYGSMVREQASITINEDGINVFLKDVKYWHSVENHPKITQEYAITIKYDSNTRKIKVASNLVDHSMNYFHTDFLAEFELLLVSAWRKKKKRAFGNTSNFTLKDSLPLTEQSIIDEINLINGEMRNIDGNGAPDPLEFGDDFQAWVDRLPRFLREQFNARIRVVVRRRRRNPPDGPAREMDRLGGVEDVNY